MDQLVQHAVYHFPCIFEDTDLYRAAKSSSTQAKDMEMEAARHQFEQYDQAFDRARNEMRFYDSIQMVPRYLYQSAEEQGESSASRFREKLDDKNAQHCKKISPPN